MRMMIVVVVVVVVIVEEDDNDVMMMLSCDARICCIVFKLIAVAYEVICWSFAVCFCSLLSDIRITSLT